MNGPLGEINLFVEVDDDRYAEPVQRIFKRIGEPVRVVAVDLEGEGARAVRGLGAVDGEVVVGPAFACAVEDSGSGVAWLVYGGSLGVWVGEGEGVPSPDARGAVFDAFLLVERAALVEG
ncbi:MAG: hypothetical protein JNL82_37025 [Myxococcales bacterium]|nr:hypothetical protein [Myxococcales bacterium]